MAKVDTSPARGTRDLLPADVSLRGSMTELILKEYQKRGFNRIETPSIENLDRLIGSGGGDNEKLVFKILKRGEKLEESAKTSAELADLGLRFDLTVPLARYYANNFARLPAVFRSIQIGPVWRAERPQKGRYRQFVQCDIDIIGEPSVVAELELISTTLDAVSALGIDNLTLRYNDRRLLEVLMDSAEISQKLRPSVLVSLDKVDKLGLDQVEAELGTILGDPIKAKHLVDQMANLSDHGQPNIDGLISLGLSAGAIEDLMAIELLGERLDSTRFLFDPTVIRGMGYYTGPIFELGVPSLGFSIGGGGRYDEMMSRFGRPSPACGFSLGFERLALYMEDKGRLSSTVAPVVHLRCASNSDYPLALSVVRRLAARGTLGLIEGSSRKLDSVLKGLRVAFNSNLDTRPEWEVLVELRGDQMSISTIGGIVPNDFASMLHG